MRNKPLLHPAAQWRFHSNVLGAVRKTRSEGSEPQISRLLPRVLREAIKKTLINHCFHETLSIFNLHELRFMGTIT